MDRRWWRAQVYVCLSIFKFNIISSQMCYNQLKIWSFDHIRQFAILWDFKASTRVDWWMLLAMQHSERKLQQWLSKVFLENGLRFAILAFSPAFLVGHTKIDKNEERKATWIFQRNTYLIFTGSYKQSKVRHWRFCMVKSQGLDTTAAAEHARKNGRQSLRNESSRIQRVHASRQPHQKALPTPQQHLAVNWNAGLQSQQHNFLCF